ncbi:alpha/beta hydrolase [Ramlibacter tataouinensis]|uniref:alpha/beta fold hydrolase n=1 Tax=Ramlibacter tataouinensis TaxID=94132 RepID=UPI0022F382BA|nr:alpha/beta hydrolase [Ramlibacter tataouinensis]WBY03007.1 alpha/beta hydrolase [Ramlibacter tataouinensis]
MTPSYTHIEGLYGSEYFDEGSGPVIVFLHGIGSSFDSFSRQIEHLSGSFRVISWGLPGYGMSAALDCEQPELPDYVDRLQQFVDWLALDSFHLVGHSLGALIGAGFAARCPERLLSLSLCSVPQGFGAMPKEVQQERFIDRIYSLCALGPAGMAERRGPRLVTPNADPEVVSRIVATMSKVRYDGYAHASHMLARADVRPFAEQIPDWLPVLLYVGSEDHITPPSDSEVVLGCLKHAVFEILPGAGHAIYLERPLEFSACIQKFVEKLGRTRPLIAGQRECSVD